MTDLRECKIFVYRTWGRYLDDRYRFVKEVQRSGARIYKHRFLNLFYCQGKIFSNINKAYQSQDW